MSTRTALLLASATILAAANPAQAQDDRYASLPDYTNAAYDAAEAAADAAAESAIEHHADRYHSETVQHTAAPRVAYSLEERDAWLADCRIVMRGEDYYYNDAESGARGNRNGGLLGGLLGALIGGVAGNRIGGVGDRLAGTLIGAGAGGVAGAVLGSVISGDRGRDDYDRGDRRSASASDAYAADYCEAYLRRYEASGSAGQYVTAYAQPVMMMQVAAPHHNGGVREIVREEWVEVADEQVEIRTRHRAAPRRAAPQQGKLTPIN